MVRRAERGSAADDEADGGCDKQTPDQRVRSDMGEERPVQAVTKQRLERRLVFSFPFKKYEQKLSTQRQHQKHLWEVKRHPGNRLQERFWKCLEDRCVEQAEK